MGTISVPALSCPEQIGILRTGRKEWSGMYHM